MSSKIRLSNGSLTATLDTNGQVAQLFYPSPSAGNHVGDRAMHHKIGVYSEGAVHWLDDGAWKVSQTYYPGRLISRTIADNHWLDIRLEIRDFIDSELSVLARNIQIINLSGRRRQIKLYLHQSFIINGNPSTSDTAQYLPAGAVKGLTQPAIAHYGDQAAFVITASCCQANASFRDFSIGHFGTYGGNYYSGVWCDAADGTLSGNLVEQGQTDSIVGFDFILPPHDSCFANYQLAAAPTVTQAVKTLQKYLHEGNELRCRKTAEYWLNWLQPAVDVIKHDIAPDYRYAAIDALLSAKSAVTDNGAVIAQHNNGESIAPAASPTVAAAVAATMAKLGMGVEAGRIYDFYTKVVAESPALWPTYTADGQPSSTGYSWQQLDDDVVRPIRLVDTAAMLLSLGSTISLVSGSKQPSAEWKKRWTKLGKPLADFLSDYIDPITKLPKPSYHLWDRDIATTTFDVAIVYGALLAASSVAELVRDVDDTIKYRTVTDDIRDNASIMWNSSKNYFYRSVLRHGDRLTYDRAIASDSLLGVQLFGLFGDSLVAAAQTTLEQEHICNNGTYLRFDGDNIHDNNNLAQIIGLSLLMSQATHSNPAGLLTSCQKMLVSNQSGSNYPTDIDIILSMIFVNSCLDGNRD